MTRRARRRAVRAAGASLAAALTSWSAVPAGAQSVEVSPLRVELTLAAGDSHTQAVTLTNAGSEPIRVRARLEDWFVSRDGTPQFDAPLPDADRPFMAADWVRLAPPEQVVQPGQQGLVRFTTTVPAGAADGGYRAAILFEFGPPGGDPVAAPRSVQFRSRVATIVYVAVGTPPAEIEMTDLTVRAADRQTPEIVATLKNTSRATVRTKGTATVRDGDGRTVRTLDVPDVPVLPMSEREVTIPTAGEMDDPLPLGTYHVEVRLDVGMPALLVGETTLTMAAEPPPNEQALPDAPGTWRGVR